MRARLEAAWRDPVLAFFFATGMQPEGYQIRYLRSNAKEIVVNKFRQSGFSWASSLRMLWRAWRGLSRSRIYIATSLETTANVRSYVDQHIAGLGIENQVARATARYIRLRNGCKIHFASSEAVSSLGLSGDVTIDEAPQFTNGVKVRECVFPMASLGYDIELIGVPNGHDALWYPAWQDPLWEHHLVQFTDSVRMMGWAKDNDGKPVYDENGQRMKLIDTIKRRFRGDDESWRSQYCNEIIDLEKIAYYSPALWEANFYPDDPICTITVKGDGIAPAACWERVDMAWREILRWADSHDIHLTRAGWDIARKRDCSDIWLGYVDDDGMWCPRAHLSLYQVSFTVQERIGKVIAEHVERLNIDRGIYGEAVLDHVTEQTSRARGYVLNDRMKALMAERLHKLMEERQIRFPKADSLRDQLMSIRRSPGSKYFKYDSARTDGSHADQVWALALMCWEEESGKGTSVIVSDISDF